MFIGMALIIAVSGFIVYIVIRKLLQRKHPKLRIIMIDNYHRGVYYKYKEVQFSGNHTNWGYRCSRTLLFEFR
ncbi:hypothetical protein MALU111345_06615 [Marinicrinis lubricantis]